jgi:hypothetical protein
MWLDDLRWRFRPANADRRTRSFSFGSQVLTP